MTTAARGACSDPIDRAILMDYWLALLPSTVEQAVDLHLLGCDACSDRLRETIALSESLSHVARSGELPVIVSDAFVRHAIAAGRQVREYAAMPGESVPCTVSADDDYLVARLGADLRGAGRVDLSLERNLPVQPVLRAHPGVGPRHALSAPGVPGQLLQLPKLGHGAARVEWHRVRA